MCLEQINYQNRYFRKMKNTDISLQNEIFPLQNVVQSDLVNPDPFVPWGFVRIREMYGLTSSVYIENRKSVPKKSWLD